MSTATQPTNDMAQFLNHFRQTLEFANDRLLEISQQQSGIPRSEGKWSPREIIGHLIDSASNNHQRFVRAQFQDDLVFPGYAQDAWVAAQRYQDAPWPELVALWGAFNRQLARVMAAAPVEARTTRRRVHNLHQIAFRPVPQHEPATLDYFMADYVDHLEHHIRQI